MSKISFEMKLDMDINDDNGEVNITGIQLSAIGDNGEVYLDEGAQAGIALAIMGLLEKSKQEREAE